MPPEERERIFERFVRGSTARGASDASRVAARHPVRGSGIGLALVKHIAESHGGRAWVDAWVDGEGMSPAGASFAISIPLG